MGDKAALVGQVDVGLQRPLCGGVVSARVLHSVKGPNGGYRLARAPNDITILQILEAVDGPIRGQPTFSEGNGSLNKRLDQICSQAAEQVRKQLQKVRISELVGKN